jgi:FKBP-type peptidyl-prolyl cis-trans isomerase 2
MSERFVPGTWVRHPDEPDWGIGQVQSVIGDRVTVNFEHAGKRLINISVVSLVAIDDETAKFT